MKLYFSGVAGPSEYQMLEAAGVRHILVDQYDLKHIPPGRANVALDSGAYRVFKRNLKCKRKLTLDLESYLAVARSRGPFDFAVSLDVIGDAEKTRENWERLRSLKSIDDPPFIPVFQWGGDPDDLRRYLDESPVVGIGGLVTSMREKDERMLEQLGELCDAYPKRLHLFGCNFLRAIEQLRTLVASVDTSKFLDGARYRQLIFVHTRTVRLSQAPAKALKLDLERADLCIQSAQNLEAFCKNSAILHESEGLSVRVFDTPLARGWRVLFVEEDRAITKYTRGDHALAGIRIYDLADKAALFEAELGVYFEAARTGRTLGECGLSALVRFGDPDHHPYATFILPEDFIRKSELKIIGSKGEEQIHSAGWK